MPSIRLDLSVYIYESNLDFIKLVKMQRSLFQFGVKRPLDSICADSDDNDESMAKRSKICSESCDTSAKICENVVKVKQVKSRKFSDVWLKTPAYSKWLEVLDGKMKCTFCSSAKKTNNFVSGSTNYQKSALDRHIASQDHKEAETASVLRIRLEKSVAASNEEFDRQLCRDKKSHEAQIRTVYMMSKKLIPAAMFNDIVDLQLSAENEELKHKLHSVRKAWSILDKEVRAYREREKIDSVLKDYATSRDVYVQTDPVKSLLSSNLGASKKKQELQSNAASSDMEKNNKFLSMHSQLLKRYERELQSNMTHLENINSLNLKINALEQHSQKEKSRCTELERQLYELRQKAKQRGHSRAVPENSPIATKMEHDRLKYALRKCDKLERQNAKFKTELRDLDDGFFEEVEDLKFALQQSARLNQEYEKTLKKMCSQFGMPYPDQLLDITGQG